MNNPKLSHFEKEDILHLAISDEKEFGSVEVSPNITAELNEENELIGIEIKCNHQRRSQLGGG